MNIRNLTISLLFLALPVLCHAQAFVPSAPYSMSVLTAFKQYTNANCAAVSVIKCGLGTFGADGIAQIDNSADPIKVTFRNHQQVLVSSAELQMAKDSARLFLLNSPALDNEAYILYAAMAKMAVVLSHDPRFLPCKNYNSALYFLDGTLTGGVNSNDLAALLGLKAVTENSRNTSLNYVGHNNYHAVYATYNKFDDFGKPKTFLDIFFLAHFKILQPYGDFNFQYFTLADQ